MEQKVEKQRTNMGKAIRYLVMKHPILILAHNLCIFCVRTPGIVKPVALFVRIGDGFYLQWAETRTNRICREVDSGVDHCSRLLGFAVLYDHDDVAAAL